jgi:hypothetical protein
MYARPRHKKSTLAGAFFGHLPLAVSIRALDFNRSNADAA